MNKKIIIIIAALVGLLFVFEMWWSQDDDASGDGNGAGGGTEPGTFRCSDAGRAMIQSEEGGCYLTAYPDAGGYSIGWGHHDDSIYQGMTITQDQAQAYFDSDIADRENLLNNTVKVNLNQNQVDALISFAFNYPAAFYNPNSSMLSAINSGDFGAASTAFGLYVFGRVDGVKQKLKALVSRRDEEQAKFDQPVDGEPGGGEEAGDEGDDDDNGDNGDDDDDD